MAEQASQIRDLEEAKRKQERRVDSAVNELKKAEEKHHYLEQQLEEAKAEV